MFREHGLSLRGFPSLTVRAEAESELTLSRGHASHRDHSGFGSSNSGHAVWTPHSAAGLSLVRPCLARRTTAAPESLHSPRLHAAARFRSHAKWSCELFWSGRVSSVPSRISVKSEVRSPAECLALRTFPDPEYDLQKGGSLIVEEVRPRHPALERSTRAPVATLARAGTLQDVRRSLLEAPLCHRSVALRYADTRRYGFLSRMVSG